MNKTMRRISFLFAALCVAAGGAYAYHRWGGSGGSASTGAAYTPVSVTRGSIDRSVISTGTLSIKETKSVSADITLTIDQVLVQTGARVAQGDALATVDTAALKTTISTLNSDLVTLDAEIASLYSTYSTEETISAGIAGRVKIIYGAVGDSLQNVMETHGAVAVLSLDGKMTVVVPASDMLRTASKLTVTNGVYSYTGTIASDTGDTLTILFSDQRILPGETVNVVLSGTTLGTGVAQIHCPYAVSTDIEGRIADINYAVGTSVTARNALLDVEGVPLPAAYIDALAQREALLSRLAQARAMLSDPTFYAPVSGIVASASAAKGTAVEANAELFSMYVGDATEMTINVDELDIIYMSVGQTGTVEMDAISGVQYPAEVTYISQLGTASAGITNYSVTIRITGDEKLKLGMNGTVTISVGEESGVALVPLTALFTDSTGQYVFLYDETHTATDDEPGVKTYVTTGLSNEDYAAVTGGLTEGQQVMVANSALKSASAATQTSGSGLNNMLTNIGTGDTGSMNITPPTGGGMGGGRTFGTDGNWQRPSGQGQ